MLTALSSLALSEQRVNKDLLITREKIIAKGIVIIGICEDRYDKYLFFIEHLHRFLKWPFTPPNFFVQNRGKFLVVRKGILKTHTKRSVKKFWQKNYKFKAVFPPCWPSRLTMSSSSRWYTDSTESLRILNNRAGADYPLLVNFDLNATLRGCPNWVVENLMQGKPANGWRETNLLYWAVV